MSGDATWLGRDIDRRIHRLGSLRSRAGAGSAIGGIAMSSTRFAAALGHPIAVRRALAGQGVIAASSLGDADVRPPRWWSPRSWPSGRIYDAARPKAEGGVSAQELPAQGLPARGLPRVLRRMPDEASWAERPPGGFAGALTSAAVPVRRLDEVAAAGPMLTQGDQARLSPRRSASARTRIAAAPAQNAGVRASAQSAPWWDARPGQASSGHAPPPGVSPPTAVSPARRVSPSRVVSPAHRGLPPSGGSPAPGASPAAGDSPAAGVSPASHVPAQGPPAQRAAPLRRASATANQAGAAAPGTAATPAQAQAPTAQPAAPLRQASATANQTGAAAPRTAVTPAHVAPAHVAPADVAPALAAPARPAPPAIPGTPAPASIAQARPSKSVPWQPTPGTTARPSTPPDGPRLSTRQSVPSQNAIRRSALPAPIAAQPTVTDPTASPAPPYPGSPPGPARRATAALAAAEPVGSADLPALRRALPPGVAPFAINQSGHDVVPLAASGAVPIARVTRSVLRRAVGSAQPLLPAAPPDGTGASPITAVQSGSRVPDERPDVHRLRRVDHPASGTVDEHASAAPRVLAPIRRTVAAGVGLASINALPAAGVIRRAVDAATPIRPAQLDMTQRGTAPPSVQPPSGAPSSMAPSSTPSRSVPPQGMAPHGTAPSSAPPHGVTSRPASHGVAAPSAAPVGSAPRTATELVAARPARTVSTIPSARILHRASSVEHGWPGERALPTAFSAPQPVRPATSAQAVGLLAKAATPGATSLLRRAPRTTAAVGPDHATMGLLAPAFPVAPPRVSIQPAQKTSPIGTPTTTQLRRSMASAAVPGSFVAATADMFRRASPSHGNDDRGGPPVTDPERGNGQELVRRAALAGAAPQPQVIRRFVDEAPVVKQGGTLPRSDVLDELVDAVAGLIEQRVVDELERRGRRHSPEVF